MSLSKPKSKDSAYYARKIVDLTETKYDASIKSAKDVMYYTGKIAALYKAQETDQKPLKVSGNDERKAPLKKKDLIYHINKIAEIQEANEKSEEAVKRYALFPILDEKGYEFLVKQELTHWSDTELDFAADRKWYDSASPKVKKVFDTILAFFLVGDGAISKNIIFRFLLECKTYEEQAMFISQLHIELVHAMTYGMAAFTFKRDPESMAELIESAQNTECVKLKMQFMEKWMLSDRPRYQRLVAFACAEGIFFCTLFAVIFWFRSKGWFPNFILANELIGNDESLHRDWGAYLFGQEISEILGKYEKGSEEYNRVYNEIKSVVYEIILDAVSIEDTFSDYILDENLEDLNASDLKRYSRLIADNLLAQLSYSPHFKSSNPFTWLEDISMEQKANFYETRVGAYKKKSMKDILNWEKRAGLVEDKINVYVNPEEVDF
jgi:ribonucleoside-diphosphate reductase subunit M2